MTDYNIIKSDWNPFYLFGDNSISSASEYLKLIISMMITTQNSESDPDKPLIRARNNQSIKIL